MLSGLVPPRPGELDAAGLYEAPALLGRGLEGGVGFASDCCFDDDPKNTAAVVWKSAVP